MACIQRLKKYWHRLKEYGLMQMLFTEPEREKMRIRKGRSKFADICLHSSASEYYALRLIYNLPIGFGLALLVYNLAWYKINFAEDSDLISPIWGGIVKWFMISCAALAYTCNPLVRCALICALASAACSTGQGMVSMFVLEKTAQGPIQNILENFGISTRITLCHLEIQAKIAKRRIELQAGPLEALFERHFGNTTTIGHKVIKTLRSLIQPFDEDIEENTEEDGQLAAIIDTAKELADRQLHSDGVDDGQIQTRDRTVEPAWKRLKSQLGRAIARRFTQRCQMMFASSVNSCHKKFEESQSLCYDSVPFPIHYFTCSRLSSLSLCQADKINQISHKFCELGESVDPARGEHETLFSSELDSEMYGMKNISKQIERQLQLNLHFQAVEAPEIERGYGVSQLHSEVRHDVEVFKIILDIVLKLFSFLVVMFTYFVFKASVETTLKYLNDIEYKNFFTTRYFWRIDSQRKEQEKMHLRPLRKEETKHNKVIGPFGCPREDEIQKVLKSFLRWSAVAFIAVIIVMLDHYFYRMLEIIVENGNVTRIQRGHSRLDVVVNGTGAIADLLRNVLNMNYTNRLNEEMSNAHCLYAPSKPKWEFTALYIITPLLIMLFLQVFFNIVIQRCVLFYVIGLMFPRRAKFRIIHLYNKLIIARVNLERLEKADEEEKKKNK